MTEPGVKITLIPNGPAQVECEAAEITMIDGEKIVKKNKFHLCRCGQSKRKPFCDGSHNECGFEG